MTRFFRLPYPILLIPLLGVIIAVFATQGGLTRWQEQALDWQFRWRGEQEPPEEIAIVAIDDDSLKQWGTWPWKRSLHAELVRKLSHAGARAMGFDVVFSEPSPEDKELAQAAQESGKVFFVAYFSRQPQGPLSSYAPSVVDSRFLPLGPSASENQQWPVAEGAVFPVDDLRQRAAGIGHVNVFPEMDGVLRRTPLAVIHQGQLFPSLPLRIAQSSGDIPLPISEIISNQKWPFDSHGELLLNFYGGYQTFRPYHPAYKILRDWDTEALRSRFASRIVLIGVTATAFADLHATPFTPRCPGVEAHAATALANFREGNFLRPAPGAVLFLLVLLAGGLGGAPPFHFRTVWSAVALAGWLAAVLALSRLLFQHFHLWLDFVAPWLAALCTYGVSVLSSLRVQEIERIRAQERMSALQQLSEMKSEYVSLVSHELRSPLSSILGFAGTLQRDPRGHFDEKTRQELW